MKTNRWTSNWSEAAGPLGRVAVCAGAGLLVFGTVSCGTSTATRPAPGAALIDASPGWHPQSRMKNSRVLSVNGVDAVGREANVAVGLTQVKLRYNWPQGGAQEVNLKFRARSDRKYSVKYAAFPPSVDQLSGTTMLSTSAEGFADAAYRVMGETRGNAAGGALGVAIIAPAILLGTIDYWHRVGKDIQETRKAAQWVDLMVISEKQSEGIVRFVRVYPSGQVIWKPWDACSNAPGNAQSGRALNSRPVVRTEKREERSDNVFRRHATAE